MTQKVLYGKEDCAITVRKNKKTSVTYLNGQTLEDKLKKDGVPSFSGESRSTVVNVTELLTWLKWSYCFNHRLNSTIITSSNT